MIIWSSEHRILVRLILQLSYALTQSRYRDVSQRKNRMTAMLTSDVEIDSVLLVDSIVSASTNCCMIIVDKTCTKYKKSHIVIKWG